MEKISDEQLSERKDEYGNVLYPREYYIKRHDSYEYRYKDSNGETRTKGSKTLEQQVSLSKLYGEDATQFSIKESHLHRINVFNGVT